MIISKVSPNSSHRTLAAPMSSAGSTTSALPATSPPLLPSPEATWLTNRLPRIPPSWKDPMIQDQISNTFNTGAGFRRSDWWLGIHISANKMAVFQIQARGFNLGVATNL